MSGIKPRHLIHALAENRAQFPRNPDVAYTIASDGRNCDIQHDILCIAEQCFQRHTDSGSLFCYENGGGAFVISVNKLWTMKPTRNLVFRKNRPETHNCFMQSKAKTESFYALMILWKILKKWKVRQCERTESHLWHGSHISPYKTVGNTLQLNKNPENPKRLTLRHVRTQIRKNFFQTIDAFEKFRKFAF